MRRIVIAVTALVVLGTASAVYAATSSPINTYTAPMKFTPGKAGSKKKPSPIGFTQDITATGTNGNRTAVTLDFLTKIYGLKVDGKDFPTCSLHKIAHGQERQRLPEGREGRQRAHHRCSRFFKQLRRHRPGRAGVRSEAGRLERRPGQADVLLRHATRRTCASAGP